MTCRYISVKYNGTFISGVYAGIETVKAIKNGEVLSRNIRPVNKCTKMSYVQYVYMNIHMNVC